MRGLGTGVTGGRGAEVKRRVRRKGGKVQREVCSRSVMGRVQIQASSAVGLDKKKRSGLQRKQ